MDHIGAESAVCTNCTVRKITFTPTRITNYYYPNTNTHWTPSVLVPFWVTVEVAMVIDFGVCSWQSEHGYVLYWWFPSQWSNLWVKRITDGSDRFFRTRESDTAHSGSQIDVPPIGQPLTWPPKAPTNASRDDTSCRWTDVFTRHMPSTRTHVNYRTAAIQPSSERFRTNLD